MSLWQIPVNYFNRDVKSIDHVIEYCKKNNNVNHMVYDTIPLISLYWSIFSHWYFYSHGYFFTQWYGLSVTRSDIITQYILILSLSPPIAIAFQLLSPSNCYRLPIAIAFQLLSPSNCYRLPIAIAPNYYRLPTAIAPIVNCSQSIWLHSCK